MKTVILCGGLGTRLREETEYRPKPMVEIGGRPVLWHIMKNYTHHGHRDFVLCLGYRGNDIKKYFLDYEAMNSDFTVTLGKKEIAYHSGHDESDLRVTLVDTGADTMTGGRLKRVGKYLQDSPDDTFLLTYGDGLCDVDINDVIRFHKSHGKLATVTTVRPMSRYGILEVEESGKVETFSEKPILEGWINIGYFVFNRKVLDYIDADSTPLEAKPLELLSQAGELMAYRHDGFFHAMDTYREYKYLNDLWAAKQAPWKVW
jgi:glucose-1-phosphate cytidylyltransferase